MQALLEPTTTWDLNLEGGVGVALREPYWGVGMFRARLGALVVRDPLYITMGLTYQLSHHSLASFGVQTEIAHFEYGYWAQAGVFKEADSRHGGGALALGIAVYGIEAQYRSSSLTGDERALSLLGKLRLPLSILIRAFGLTQE